MRHFTEHGAKKAFGVNVEKLIVEAGLRRVLSERIPADAGSEALTPLPTWRVMEEE